jgi:hypothetical protein
MSQKLKIVKYSKFEGDESHFEFFKPLTNENGGKNIGFHYKGNSLALQTPKLETPYGFSRGREDKPNEYNKKFTCTLGLDSTTERKSQFVDELKKFEQALVTKGMENAFEWGLVSTKAAAKKVTEDTIREKFTSIVKYKVDKETGEISTKYSPTFRTVFKTEMVTGDEVPMITSEVYDDKGTAINYEKDESGVNRLIRPETVSETTIPRHSECIALVEGKSIWVANGNFGITFRIRQIRVTPGDFAPTGVMLIEDDSDDEDEGPSRPRQSNNGPQMVDDEEEEEEAENDEEEENGEEEEENAAPASRGKLSLKSLRK